MASITQEKKGAPWRYRIRFKDNGKWRETSKSGYKLKSEAEAAAAEIEKQLRKGIHVDDAKRLIGEYLDYFLKIRKEEVRPGTYTRLEYQIRLYIKPKFEFTQLGDLTRHDCNEWVSELKTKYKLKASTARSVIGTFRSAITYAVIEDRILEMNPLAGIKLPKIERSDEQIKYFTHDELTTLLTYVRDNPLPNYPVSKQYYVLFTLLAHTGLRIGEALGLTWADIQGNRLTVDKQITHDSHNGASFAPPKTDSSYRTIAIDPLTQQVLKLQRKNRLECVARYQSCVQPSGEFQNLIFYSSDGKPMRHTRVRDQMKKFCGRAGVPELSPHAFRHTHAVLLLESGANIKVVSERLGHATIDMTANVYLHITEKMEEDAIDKFASFI